MNQIIIHVDMDAFFASVETRDNPALRGKPLIIGALPKERGVVATCSYEARKFGVHSAMNIKEAFRLCPHGIYMHPNIDKYRMVSKQLHEIWNTYASAAETIALDEAYLDVTEQAGDLEGARKIALMIKRRTREELGLTCSVGVAYSKTAAKTASEEKKPDGYFEIPTAKDFVDLIIDRDVRVLYTVGEMTAEKLYAAGIRTVRDIREKRETVIRLLGKQGQWIAGLASGVDDRKVTPYRPQDAKSISREVTFQADVNNYELLRDVLVLLSLCVEQRAKRYGLHGSGITLKITYADMKGITRSKGAAACVSAADICREAVHLLNHVERRPVRLIGVGIYNLSDRGERQLTLDDFLRDSRALRWNSRVGQCGENHNQNGIQPRDHSRDHFETGIQNNNDEGQQSSIQGEFREIREKKQSEIRGETREENPENNLNANGKIGTEKQCGEPGKNSLDKNISEMLDGLRKRYHLDFAGHLEQIYQSETLHRTVEYMRKHI